MKNDSSNLKLVFAVEFDIIRSLKHPLDVSKYQCLELMLYLHVVKRIAIQHIVKQIIFTNQDPYLTLIKHFNLFVPILSKHSMFTQ